MVALSGSDRRPCRSVVNCEEQVAPQASRLSIRNDGQDARPTGNPRSFGDRFPSFPMGLQ